MDSTSAPSASTLEAKINDLADDLTSLKDAMQIFWHDYWNHQQHALPPLFKKWSGDVLMHSHV
jgi:hypothetical protein